MVDASDIFHDSLPLAPERPATVFLSYRRGDVEEVKYLQQRLKIYGMRAWRDVTNLGVGDFTHDEIVHAIEQESDAFVIYLTPRCLESDFIWDVEVPTALRRWEREHAFKIVPILRGVSRQEVQNVCAAHGLPTLTAFNDIVLPDHIADVYGGEFNEKLREIASRVLEAVLSLRLRRSDRAYELGISLKTFTDKPPVDRLDLDLDWRELFPKPKEGILPPVAIWQDVLLPALNDVKDILSEMIPNRRLHVFVQAILPVAFAMGFVFPRSAHFTLMLEGDHGTWSTKGSTSASPLPLCCMPYTNTGDKHIALMDIAIARDTAREVTKSITNFHLLYSHHLHFEPIDGPNYLGAVKDASHALAMSQQIGRELRRLCDTKEISHIHLFASLPAALAVMVGHEFNALCAITLYHHATGKGYIRACTLGADTTGTTA